MTKKDFKILLDMDDVLENLLDAWVNYLNNKYDLTVNVDSINKWEIEEFFPTLIRDQIYEPLELPEFWSTVKPNKEAMHYVKLLYDAGFDIYICTSTHHNIVTEKFKRALKPYYPYINWQHIIVANKKQMVKADVLVDDNYNNLVDGQYTGILYDRPHNRNFIIPKGQNIYREYDWLNIYTRILLLYSKAQLSDTSDGVQMDMFLEIDKMTKGE